MFKRFVSVIIVLGIICSAEAKASSSAIILLSQDGFDSFVSSEAMETVKNLVDDSKSEIIISQIDFLHNVGIVGCEQGKITEIKIMNDANSSIVSNKAISYIPSLNIETIHIHIN